MGLLRSALELLASSLVYSLVVAGISVLVVFLFSQDISKTVSFFPLLLLLEGGLGLVAGGVFASFSPTVGKVSETVLHSKPWDAKRQKEAERQARVWIGTGILLILMGFLASLLSGY